MLLPGHVSTVIVNGVIIKPILLSWLFKSANYQKE